MGEHEVFDTSDAVRTRLFTRALVDDIRALQTLIDRDLIETGVRRVGVEQEMYLVDAEGFPAPVAIEVLAALKDSRFGTELALFNLEANLPPLPMEGRFLRTLETGLADALGQARAAARTLGFDALLTGIAPTLRAQDVTRDKLTPEVRYGCLNDASMAARAGELTLQIDGIERFESSHDCVVIEGANTSLQLHLQVDPVDSGRLYNLMQLTAAPLLAAAANSPVLLGHRVWHETRVALFEHALEYRSLSQLSRGLPSRVGFGDAWVKESVIEIFQENAARYHVIMTRASTEDSPAQIERGVTPDLAALCLHNGTVWRWNRPCYGITDGKPHLRLESRALPSGPSIVDEMANAALFYGMMTALDEPYGEVSQRLTFAEARANFLAAAKLGVDARFTWLDGRHVGARDLLLTELIPAARAGLEQLGVPDADVARYLGIMEERVATGMTGARWLLDGLENEEAAASEDIRRRAVTMMMARQDQEVPVHRWDSPRAGTGGRLAPRTLADIMTRDVFTVRPDDVIDLATSVMEWRHVRHVPVESPAGELVGLLSARHLIRLRERANGGVQGPLPVSAVMERDLVAVPSTMTLADAMQRMLSSETGCLLVVDDQRLLGIVTEHDMVRAATALLSEDERS
jgi:CBS domain-containing protein